MNILVIGSGGREHALVWKLRQSDRVEKIYVAPGNAGTKEIAENIDIKPNDIVKLLSFAKDEKIDLTVVGPEVPLAMGIVDLFEDNNLRIFGPKKVGAEIEASKSFAKELMQKYDIPTASYQTFNNFDNAKKYLENVSFPQVVKADGLAAGKGVLIAQNYKQAIDAITLIMKDEKFGSAGSEVVIEEFLEGHEISLLAFADGNIIIPMDTAQDHKKIYDGDEGPNTGGMGAYSPAKRMTEEELKFSINNILEATFKAMRDEGIRYKGVLYAGLMLTSEGPKVLEFNCRFGDPETQVLLPRLKNDLVDVMEACIDGSLDSLEIEWDEKSAVCVVLASEGYPEKYTKGYKITGLENVDLVFHAGTTYVDGNVLTAGGRVLGVTVIDNNLENAVKRAYSDVEKIYFEGKYYRTDIAKEAL
ncbi:MAG: phosphoribosylamine--glycine ligase [Clostridia bacterium]